MKSVVVTGSTGFIGTSLVPHLKKHGYKVIEINRKAIKGGFTYQDLLKSSLSGDTWIHMAGVSKDTDKAALAAMYHQVNVTLTIEVFNAFLQDKKATCFVFVSSIKAAAANPVHVVKETDQFEIDKPYGTSKREAEQWLSSQTLPIDKKLIILRPVMVVGKHKEGNLYSLFKFVRKGLPYPLAAFSSRKSFLSIENLLFVFEHIISHDDFPAGLYHVCDSQIISTNEIVTFMYQTAGFSNRSLHIPVVFFRTFAAIAGKLGLPFNLTVLSKLTGDYLVSNHKLLEAMGCKLPYQTHEKMKETIEWFYSVSKK